MLKLLVVQDNIEFCPKFLGLKPKFNTSCITIYRAYFKYQRQSISMTYLRTWKKGKRLYLFCACKVKTDKKGCEEGEGCSGSCEVHRDDKRFVQIH